MTTSGVSSTQNAPIRVSSHALSDVITWLKDSDAYVVLYLRHQTGILGRFFHACQDRTASPEEMKAFVNTHQVIYLDATRAPTLWSGWTSEIPKAGFPECTCGLKSLVSKAKDIPWPVFLEIDTFSFFTPECTSQNSESGMQDI